jgi:hypothetical protein
VYGKRRVLKAVGIAEGTFWRAMSGGSLYHKTYLSIETGLDTLEREAP